MAAPKRSPTEIARDRARTSELYLRGWTQQAIAAELDVSQAQISKDLKTIRKEWLGSSIRDFDETKAEELAKIDRLEREAWEAYTRTVGPHTVTTSDEGFTPKGAYEKNAERTEHLAGNPAFLQLVMSCIDRRCEILGIDAPQKLEHTGKDGGPIEHHLPDYSGLNQDERAELRRLLLRAAPLRAGEE